MVCAHWRTHGPALEANDELARSGIERIHRDSPRSWVRTPGGGWLFAKLCRLPQDRRRLLHHEGVGDPLGDPTRGCSALHVGLAFGYGPAFRRVAWHSAKEPRTEVPAPGLLPHRYQRK